jgi:hypothetical protein
MMEKYDGVRVFWDGKQLQYSRNTNIAINIPDHLALGSTPFEGELW